MIALRYMKRDDVQTVLSWQDGSNADDLYQWAGIGYKYPITEEQIMQRLDDQEVNHPGAMKHIYVIELTPTREVIGQIELVINNTLEGIGSIGKFYIGNPRLRGQGYGKKVLTLLMNKAFEEMALKQLFLKVFDFNEQAIRCYEHMGFIIVKKEYKVYKGIKGYWNRYYMLKENDRS